MNRRCSVALVALLLGCGSQVTERKVELEPAEIQLRNIGQAYVQAVQRLKRGPRDFEEFKPFVLALPEGEATARSIAGRQIVVIWNLNTSDLAIKSTPDAPPRFPVLAYFTTREGDIRFVLTGTSRIEQMNEEQFHKAYFPKGHKPSF